MWMIDGDALIEYCNNQKVKTVSANDIARFPTVDAVPVKHGRWIMMGGMKPPEYHHHHQCSVCESYAQMRPPYGGKEELSPFCPACGAKMDLEEQENAT